MRRQASFPLRGAGVARRRLVLAPVLLGMVFACAPKPQPSLIGGPFSLTDQNGARVNESILKGKWSAVFFGYTFCPDTCPTTLTALARAIDNLGPRAGRLQVVFISVDPARDTPAQLKAYLSSPAFPKGAIGLTGSGAQVAAAARAWRVYYRKVGSGADYSMDHTAIVYLMDPQGRFSQPVDTAAPPAKIAEQLSRAMDAS